MYPYTDTTHRFYSSVFYFNRWLIDYFQNQSEIISPSETWTPIYKWQIRGRMKVKRTNNEKKNQPQLQLMSDEVQRKQQVTLHTISPCAKFKLWSIMIFEYQRKKKVKMGTISELCSWLSSWTPHIDCWILVNSSTPLSLYYCQFQDSVEIQHRT